MLFRFLLISTALFAVIGCASATLPYTPERQPSGARLSAAYQMMADRVRIEIDTDGKRLEEATIVKADGSVVRPQSVEAAPVTAQSSPLSVGVGIGGGTFGGGSSTVERNTYAFFPADQAGPPPWRVRVKLAGVEPVVIVAGGPSSGAGSSGSR